MNVEGRRPIPVEQDNRQFSVSLETLGGPFGEAAREDWLPRNSERLVGLAFSRDSLWRNEVDIAGMALRGSANETLLILESRSITVFPST
jgi:hypothetical protein